MRCPNNFEDEFHFDASQINFGFKGSLFESSQNYRPTFQSKVPIIRLDAIGENQLEEQELKESQQAFGNEEDDNKNQNQEAMELEGEKDKQNGNQDANMVKQASLSDLMSQIN